MVLFIKEIEQMNEIVAYCGLVCQGCPIYWASRETDAEKRQKLRIEIAQICNKQYRLELKPEDITDCDGCRAESGRLFSGCLKCDIRKCARQMGLENCAHCNEYVCEKLQQFFVNDPGAKTRLDAVRSIL